MKIAMFSHSSGMGGSERALVEIAEEAARRGHDVAITVPSPGALSDLVVQRGLEVPRVLRVHRWMSRRGKGMIGFIRLIQCLFDIPRCLQFLVRWQPDVVIVNSSVTPGPMFASWLCRLPSVIVVRELIVSGESLSSFLPKKTMVHLIRKWAGRVVAVSCTVSEQVGGARIIFSNSIPNVPLKPNVERGGGPLRVVYLGSLMIDKRPEDAIQAVCIASSMGAQLKLDVFGSGSAADHTRLRDSLSKCPDGSRIRLRGEAAGPEVALEDADLLIMTSTNEAFGRVTTEALMAGIPVVGYDLRGTAEVIGRAGGGVLVKPNPYSLATELARIAGDQNRLDGLRKEARQAGAFWASYRSDALMIDLVEDSLALAVRAR